MNVNPRVIGITYLHGFSLVWSFLILNCKERVVFDPL